MKNKPENTTTQIIKKRPIKKYEKSLSRGAQSNVLVLISYLYYTIKIPRRKAVNYGNRCLDKTSKNIKRKPAVTATGPPPNVW